MPMPIRRRDLLKRAGCGFGYLALASLAAEQAAAARARSTRWLRVCRTSPRRQSG